ncbi:hypothetical protein D3C76_1534380 [compost metagenome]
MNTAKDILHPLPVLLRKLMLGIVNILGRIACVHQHRKEVPLALLEQIAEKHAVRDSHFHNTRAFLFLPLKANQTIVG